MENEEDHKFSGQRIDFAQLLQDDEAFENVFFPPISMDYNPMNINEYIDFNELHQLLNEEKSAEGVQFDVRNEGGVNRGHGRNRVAFRINNGGLMNAERKVEENVKKQVTKKSCVKGSVEAAQMRELTKIRNRESASRAFAKKKAYIQELELEVQTLRKKNANLKKLLHLFSESCPSLDMTQKQLRRTTSGPM
ncbi:Uncharacterized protein TCM_004733 [Theobroma cacao]|uniref:BZIP domain-containing protein n=1 Tax=Theobroma cacao TaxID=3641 RepID=A0A061DSZ9_THECC|nr:Uncharacterized protein TCM_004733 [Theobroma cacao]